MARLFIVPLCCLLMITGFASANEGPLKDVIPRESARRVGLDVAWTTHVQVDPTRGEIAYVAHHVSSKEATTLFTVEHENGREVISEHDINAFGEVLGVEGARTTATVRAEVLKEDGLDAVVTETVVPKITLYVLTDQALVHAIDGETGGTLWTAPVGKRTNPPSPIDADDDYVVLVNGMDIYCLEADTGRTAWSRRLKQAPGSGPVLANNFAFVPLLNGMVEAFPLDNPRLASESFMTVGHNYAQPAVTNRTISWGNDRGHLNVAFSDRIRNVAYRIEAGGDFESPAIPFMSDYLVAASSDGYIHCIHEMSGRILWEVSTGEKITQSPFAVDDVVFAATTNHNLYRVKNDAATFDWVIPGVKSIVSVTDDRLYCQSNTHELLILDRESGARIQRLPAVEIDFWFPNLETDRIFIGSRSGLIQCLREVNRHYPQLHIDNTEVDEDEDDNAFRARGSNG